MDNIDKIKAPGARIKTSFEFDRILWRQFKMVARKRGMSTSNLLRQYVYHIVQGNEAVLDDIYREQLLK